MEDTKANEQSENAYLSNRLNHLEETNRWHLHTLNVISALCNLYQKPKAIKDPVHLISQTAPYILQVTPFSVLGFCSLSSDNNEVDLDYINNEQEKENLRKDLEYLIESGDFAWALHSHIPQVYHQSNRTTVLASVTTPTRIRGIFIGHVPASSHFKEHHKKGLHAIIQNCAYALESHELQHVIKGQNEHLIKSFISQNAKLKAQESVNQLTNLPNRQNFKTTVQQHLEHAASTGEKVAVVLLNLDLFKRVNESLGHDVGDYFLKAISQRLLQSLKQAEINRTQQETHSAYSLSHFGADEFCILLTDICSLDQIKKVMLQLNVDFSKPHTYENEVIIQTFSAGISLFPDNSNNATELLQFADIALDQAKKKGRNQYLFYANDEQFRVIDQLSLARDLHRALEKEEFTLFFQPQINTKINKVTGIEALIRWTDHKGQTIPPDKFIPLAEDTGLIIPIGNWVIDEACRNLKILQDFGFHDIPMSINIAAQQFAEHDFVETLSKTVEKYQLSTELIELELTERVVMGDVKTAISTLMELRNAGYKIAIDDFGTGYSSLSYIKHLPIDRLKIDKSFISDIPRDRGSVAIVKAITQLAQGINMEVIAEGVENLMQVEMINSLGCYEAQGYLYCKPICMEDLISYLRQPVSVHSIVA
ncbi:MAG: bifunctional diguanylate cyclase/phosphodiesterase [Pseudomonadales bacterium]|nr:bifunctional diguanylate cyclase/phosphodiesterase [Pseudomonadales bacterium]